MPRCRLHLFTLRMGFIGESLRAYMRCLFLAGSCTVLGALSGSALVSTPTSSPVKAARAPPSTASTNEGRFFGEVPTDMGLTAGGSVPPLEMTDMLDMTQESGSSRHPPPPNAHRRG